MDNLSQYYHARIKQTEHVSYSAPMMPICTSLSDPAMYIEPHHVEKVYAIYLTESQLQKLNHDVGQMQDEKQVREHHHQVYHAWHEYMMLLRLYS